MTELKCLDLFCGMGGWSVGFHRQGFKCQGVDLTDVGYPYEFVHQNIFDFHPNGFKPDVVVASPPCRDFSILTRGLHAMHPLPDPPNPARGLKLVAAAKRIIQEAKPRYWLIENVSGAVKDFYPLLGSPSAIIKPYYLWGDFPRFFRESSYMAPKIQKMGLKTGSMLDAPGRFSPLAPWLRAKIPFPLALGLAKVCREALERDHTNSSKDPEK